MDLDGAPHLYTQSVHGAVADNGSDKLVVVTTSTTRTILTRCRALIVPVITMRECPF